MKKIVSFFVIGVIVALFGILVSDICGDVFNGMDYGSACTVGMLAYLCVVVVTCTGLIISKLDNTSEK